MGTRGRTLVVVVLLVAAVVVFFVVRQTGDDGDGGGATFELSVPAGGPTSIEELDAKQGEEVHLTVELAEAGEVHVHGYDLMEETGPGEPPAEFDFVASDAGIFEIEIEDTGTQFAELRVTP